MLSKIKYIVLYMLECFFYLFPVWKKIVFINFNGRGFGCNPKYIALGCIEAELDVELVWLGSKYYDEIPKKIRQVRWGSLRFYYELATAKVIITNVKNKLPFRKKKNQWMIQTWHGSNAFKFVEKEAEGNLSVSYIRESKENSKITDIFLSDGPRTSKWYREAMWCECAIEETFMPRDDILIKNSPNEKEKIKKRLNIADDLHLLMYAPTFRDNKNNPYNLDYDELCRAFSRKFGGAWKMILRFHPNEAKLGALYGGECVINVSEYSDVQELNLIADALITDYSSICNDFFLMDKLVFLYVPDYEEYLRNNRCLKDNFYQIPLQRNKTNEELLKNINDFSLTTYSKQIAAYKEKYTIVSDGQATKRVISILNDIIDGKRTK